MIHPPSPVLHVQDLKIMACHGVFPQEKIHKQPFLVSLDLFLAPADWYGALAQDKLDQTICYASACAFTEKFVTEKNFDLLETLALKLGEALLEAFPRLRRVKIRIQKPNAPFDAVFEAPNQQKNIAVSLTCEKSYPIGIALGSNLEPRRAMLSEALAALERLDGLEISEISPRLETAPWGKTDQGDFLNQCVLGRTVLDPFALLNALKSTERALGRTVSEKWGPRLIDLDLIFYENITIRHPALTLPHPYTHQREFVLKPFYLLCPELKIGQKTVKEWLERLSAEEY